MVKNVQGRVCSRAEGWETGIFEVLMLEDPGAAFVVCKKQEGLNDYSQRRIQRISMSKFEFRLMSLSYAK